MQKWGPRFAPFVFMSFHIGFFLVSTIFAMIAYLNFYAHTLLMALWTTASLWNGANFYMEYFSKKYESNLKMLDEIEQKLTNN